MVMVLIGHYEGQYVCNLLIVIKCVTVVKLYILLLFLDDKMFFFNLSNNTILFLNIYNH